MSDIADGYVARKTKTTSRAGEVLDGIADMVLIAVVLIIFIPILNWEAWMLYWMGIIAFIRFGSLSIGFVKYRALANIHTYANKITGIVLACFPMLFLMFGLTITAIILCGIAILSALDELIINVRSNELDANRTSSFYKERKER